MRQNGDGFRLVATDLDGTLMGPDGAVSERTEAALLAARAQGLAVVLATGRPPRWVRGVVDDGTVHELVICSNGALVYDPAADRVVKERPLGTDVLAALVEQAALAFPGAALAVERGLDPLRKTPGGRFEGGLTVATPSELVVPGASKLLIRDGTRDQDELAAVVTRLAGSRAQVTYSGYDLVEVSGAGVTKGSTLRALCDDLGVGAEEVIAFGDMPNDLSMLTWAGHAVAVANAHPAVLEVADEVAPPNGDDGVAQVLERILFACAQPDQSGSTRHV